jgi:hypothetical protein
MRHGEGQERDTDRYTSMIECIIGKDEKARSTRFADVKEKTSTTPPDALPWAC